jgi:ATP-dependent Lon protease
MYNFITPTGKMTCLAASLKIFQDQKLLQALIENRRRSAPYAGAFLVKDEEGTDPNIVTSSDSEKSIDDLKGKELLKRIHEVGTLAQVI